MADVTEEWTGVADRLGAIRARIDTAARRAGRNADAVHLVAVSKFQPPEAVAAALAARQTLFGENRVQEAERKIVPLRVAHPDLRLHVIGALQTNKARLAVRIADVIETLDRPALADAVEEASQREGRLPRLLVQVNIGGEPQKSGVDVTEADGFIGDVRRRFGDALIGLMCIPPVDRDPAPFFHRLAALGEAHGLATLSMGMSEDFEAAVACGATHVRIGSAIFGARGTATA